MNRERKISTYVPRELYEEIGSREKVIELMKKGLLSLRITSLENEIADLVEKTKQSETRISELPDETERLEEVLKKAIRDRKALEKMLDRRK